MLFSNGVYCIKSQCCESKDEVFKCLSNCENGFIEFTKTDHCAGFVVIEYRRIDESKWFGIVICVENTTFLPTVTTVTDNNMLLIGHNNSVTLFNLHMHQIIFDYTFLTPVYIIMSYKNTVVISDEIDVLQVKLDGRIVVKRSLDDLLVSFRVINNSIELYTADSKIEVLKLKDV